MPLGRRLLEEYASLWIEGGSPSIQPNSIDLTLHTTVGWHMLPNGRHQTIACGHDEAQIQWEHNLGRIVLRPGDFRLVCTAELIEMPYDLRGQLLGKSSRARDGLQVEAAGLCDSGYRGRPTLELKNLGDLVLILYPGDPICQLEIERVEGATIADVYRGKYQDVDDASGARL